MEDSNFDLEEEEKKVKATKGKFARQRQLKQFRDLSDDEFNQRMAQKALGLDVSEEFEKRIAKKWQEFEEDYDLSDLKINDKDTLRALIQAQISLEDCEQALFNMRAGGITQTYLINSEKLSKTMSDLRSDISKFQDDLSIKRK